MSLQAIFVDTEDTGTVKSMLEQRNLADTLKQDPDRWTEWSKDRIFPLLDGENLEKLVLYFDTLYLVTSDDTFLRHKDALSLLHNQGVNLDYIRLLNSDLSVLEAVDSNNVETICRAVEKIPQEGEQGISPSVIYFIFAEKQFYKLGQSSGNWVESFSSCQDILDKLKPESFKNFVSSTLVSEKSLSLIPRAARSRLLKKSVKFVEIKIAEKSAGDWNQVETWTKLLKSHLDKFSSKLTTEILSSLSEEELQAVDRLELTGGDEDKIAEFFIRLINSGAEEHLVRKLMVIWKQDDTVIDDGFSKIFSVCVESLKTESEKRRELTSCIRRLVEEFEFCPDNMRSVLSPLCTMESLSVSDRLVFVQLIKGTEKNEEEEEEFDSNLLSELYQVQEKLNGIIPGCTVTERDLESLQSKTEMLDRIIVQCGTTEQLLKLGTFIAEYFSQNKETCRLCQLKLVKRCTEIEPNSGKIVDLVLRFRDYLKNVDIEETLSLCMEKEKELFVLLVLKLELEEKYADITKVKIHSILNLCNKNVTYLQILEEIDSLEDSTFVLVIERGLGASLASSPLYPRLVEAALAEDLASDLVNQLNKGGYRPLALALQVNFPSLLIILCSYKIIEQDLMVYQCLSRHC